MPSNELSRRALLAGTATSVTLSLSSQRPLRRLLGRRLRASLC
jgi:hypothetical protein